MLRFATLFFLVLNTASSAAPDFYLEDGDTVVFYGDSITDRRIYTVFTETFAITMPVETSEETLALAVRLSDFTQALNQQTLKVTGLCGGRYSLEIDGSFVGTFKARRLTLGINLAGRKTPMRDHADAVYSLVLRHNHVHFARRRMIEESFRDYKMSTVESAAKSLDAVELEALDLLRNTAQPKARRYRLTKQ